MGIDGLVTDASIRLLNNTEPPMTKTAADFAAQGFNDQRHADTPKSTTVADIIRLAFEGKLSLDAPLYVALPGKPGLYGGYIAHVGSASINGNGIQLDAGKAVVR